MTGIIDYNAGNIKSVERALEALKVPYISAKTPEKLQTVDRLIFPGVGEASFAMEELKKTGFDVFLKEWVKANHKVIGICLGSQIVFDYSEEGATKCLGLIPGIIRHFSALWEERNPTEEEHKETSMFKNKLKVPHIGWNDVSFCNGGTKLTDGIADKSNFYFVHSYVIQPDDPIIIKGYSSYGTMVPAIVEYGSITAFQFHPEKSGEVGLQILKNFVKDDIEETVC